ncbi:MAG: hypothetical protein QXZ11_03175 [Thermoproteota archaeon]
MSSEKGRRVIAPNDLSIVVAGFDRPAFASSHFRLSDVLTTQPTPEKSLITLTEYLIGKDDLASLAVLGRLSYIDKRILVYLDGIFNLVLKYGEDEGNRFKINMRRIYEADREEYETAQALLRTYNLLLWAVRMTPNLSRMVNALLSQMEYPQVQRTIVERAGQRMGAGLMIGSEEQLQPRARGRRRRTAQAPASEAPVEEVV